LKFQERSMKSQAEKAEEFRALHHGSKVLILPNCWDVPSARVFEDSGFPAIATSSAGMMVSLGYPDGETIEFKDYLSAVKRISRVVAVPLSVDVVAGFGQEAERVLDTVKSVVEAGAVGINIEDFATETKELYPVGSQVEKIRAIRKFGNSSGVPVVINARTDALRYAKGDDREKFGEAVSRAKAYRDAGADCVYPMGLVAKDGISEFVKLLSFPVNVMVRKGLPPVGELRSLGVARVSFGPSASYAAMGLLKRASKEILEEGTYDALTDGAISFDELNSLAKPK
jgi:2-methylisocitrate lyase-like PEP mutase family enzyme